MRLARVILMILVEGGEGVFTALTAPDVFNAMIFESLYDVSQTNVGWSS